MAYNLEPLIKILEQILEPHQQRWILDHHKKPQIESLLQKASSLNQILESSKPSRGLTKETLETQIRDAAHKAQDIIESHIVDQMLSNPGGESFTVSPPDLQQVIQQLDSAMENMDVSPIPDTSLPGVSVSPDPTSSKDVVVGLDEDLYHLKDRLTGHQSKLEIIPIVGMGGIGKTTLARKLYDDALIISHFDTRAWITISQEYNVRAILLGLLGCITGKQSDEHENSHLALILYKNLCGRRYLVVLDDMWSTNAWDDMRRFFPAENNSSRIVLTTRELDVANYMASSSTQHQMHLLNEFESWDLLNQKVFGKENCPGALEMIGRNIASNCGGLPLAIDVIGGLLSEAERTEELWEDVANHIGAAIAEKDNKFSNILSLSYNHLPSHLRPCFLYMGAFPEDYEIRTTRLVRLWVAEGFLKSNGDKTLEEVAEDYLKALVDRSLVSIGIYKSNGKAKSYRIHDLLRDLCMRIADLEKFLYVNSGRVDNVDSSYSLRRVSVHPTYRICDIFDSEEFMSLTRSFLGIDLSSHADLSPVFFGLRLLRVLDVLDMKFEQFPTEILQLVNLRYLAFDCSPGLHYSISRLCNLQTLIFRTYTGKIPTEIWEMLELRHLKLFGTIFSIPDGYVKNHVQEKLQTISWIDLNGLLECDFFRSIPNIKNMGIYCESSYRVVDLSHLHKLETFRCLSDFSLESSKFLSSLRLPPSIRKLSIINCSIPLQFMETLSSLPNLQVLKIWGCTFHDETEWELTEEELELTEEESEEESEEELELTEEESEEELELTEEESEEELELTEEEWELTEEEFPSLQFLLLACLKLVRWRADETNFPSLRHLVISKCSKLEEIPCGIGEISTLETIEVTESSVSVVASARKIEEDQRDNGNYDLTVVIHKGAWSDPDSSTDCRGST